MKSIFMKLFIIGLCISFFPIQAIAEGQTGFFTIDRIYQRQCLPDKGFEVLLSAPHANPDGCASDTVLELSCDERWYLPSVKVYLTAYSLGAEVDAFVNGCDADGHALVKAVEMRTAPPAPAAPPAPVPKTGLTESLLPGDDGNLQKGVTWPDPRFTDNGDGTVKDNLTGLIWLKNAGCWIFYAWEFSLNLSNNLADGQCELTDGSSPGDWRLPNFRELYSLVDYGNNNPMLPTGHPFVNVATGDERYYYWSSTLFNNDSVYTLSFFIGVSQLDTRNGDNGIWPVRGGN